MGQVVLRKHLFIIIVTIVAIVTFLVLHLFGFTGLGSRMEFQTISRGIWSGHGKARYYVIQNIDEWTQVWSKHTQGYIPPDPLPKVNFSKKTVIAVFAGTYPWPKYEIEIREIMDTGLSIVVRVEKVPSGLSYDAVVTPYHIVKLNKIDKYVIFHMSTREITD